MVKRTKKRPEKYDPKISLKEEVEFGDLISLSLGKKLGQDKVKVKKKTAKKNKSKK